MEDQILYASDHDKGSFDIDDELREIVGDVVKLRLPADQNQLPLLRLLAEGISARAQFDLTAIADMKLAVNEAATSLIRGVSPGASLDCWFTRCQDALTMTLSTVARSQGTLDTETIGWRLLVAVTDSLATRAQRLSTGFEWQTRIQLTKRRRSELPPT
jgi:serine/threonine-protein kinase RsbW